MRQVGRLAFGKWAAVAALGAALAACGGGGSGTTDALHAQSAVSQTARSATCSFEHVYVTVQSIRVLQQADAGEQWIDIALDAPASIDLLNTTGGLLQALGAAPLASGHYTALRLVLLTLDGANQIQPSAGALEPLEVPGAAQAGLMIKGDFVVPAGQLGDIALEGFDACQSVVQAGSPASPRFQLKPGLSVQASVVAVANNSAQRVNFTTAGAQLDASVARLTDGGFVVVWAYPGPNQPYQQWCLQRYSAAAVGIGGERCFSSGNIAALPVVTGLPDGGWVVAWVVQDEGAAPDLRLTGIMMLQFRADGSNTDFARFANILTAGSQAGPGIAALAGGGYVITWLSDNTVGGNTFYARRYDAGGVPLGPEQPIVQIAPSLSGGPSAPAVAPLPDGGYVITWTQRISAPFLLYQGVNMQRFAADGTAVGSQALVSPDEVSDPPVIAGLSGGGFVIAWVTLGVDGQQVVAQQFSAAGAPVGSQTIVRAITVPATTCPLETAPCPAEIILDPAVGALDDGGYVISWYSVFRTGGTSGTYARRYTAAGMAAGDAVLVNAGIGRRPAVSGTGGAGFVIVWDDNRRDTQILLEEPPDAKSDVFARHFDSSALSGGAAP